MRKLFKVKTLEQCQSHRSSVFIVNFEHVSKFVIIFNFEQANVCWVQKTLLKKQILLKTRSGISCVML